MQLKGGLRSKQVAVVLGAVMLAMSGCGSDSGSGSGSGGGKADTDTVEASVEALKGVPVFEAPGPAVDVPALAGKKIFNIPISSEIPFDQAITESMKQIADQAGMEFINFPNQGQPSQWVQGINQAIAEKPDLLILQGAPNPASLQPQLKQVRDAGIPVLVTHHYGSESKPDENVTAQVVGPFVEAAQAEIDYAVAQAGDDTDIVAVISEEFPATKDVVDAMEARMDEVCPGCGFTTVNVAISDWATKIQGAVQAALVENPNANWVLPIYDGMTPFAAAGITAAGRSNAVKIATFNGTPAILKMIQDDDVVAMDVGENPDWLAHANMDQVFRLLSGAAPVEGLTTPLRIFDDSNVGDAGTPPKPGVGYGEEYVDGYAKLWGLNS